MLKNEVTEKAGRHEKKHFGHFGGNNIMLHAANFLSLFSRLLHATPFAHHTPCPACPLHTHTCPCSGDAAEKGMTSSSYAVRHLPHHMHTHTLCTLSYPCTCPLPSDRQADMSLIILQPINKCIFYFVFYVSVIETWILDLEWWRQHLVGGEEKTRTEKQCLSISLISCLLTWID